MSDFSVGTGPFFNKGIESITFKGGEALQGLPDHRELTPADHAERPRLERLLAQPNLESFLEDGIKPELNDRELLMPGHFRQVMESTRSLLGHAAQERQSTDPDAAKALNRAVRLLNEEVALRDLLAMYRSVLYQG